MRVLCLTSSLLVAAACTHGDAAQLPAAAELGALGAPEATAADDPAPPPRADFDTPRLAEPMDHGDKLGSFQLTYYWVAHEGRGRRRIELYDKRCRPLARVTRSFARRVRLEGTGRLRDGRLITAAGACDCASVCFAELPRDNRWGAGVAARPLSPFRSIAVDPSRVSIGQTLYIPELDGLTMPGARPHGGFVHDGCVIAEDRGGGVRGRHIDFFTARKSHYRALFRRHRLTRVTVFDGAERCSSLANGKPLEGTAVAVRSSS